MAASAKGQSLPGGDAVAQEMTNRDAKGWPVEFFARYGHAGCMESLELQADARTRWRAVTDFFDNDGLRLAFVDAPAAGGGQAERATLLLVHGFASTMAVNWIDPGWVETLTKAGHRVVAFDHRGHGASDKPHEPEAYTPQKMVGDVFALLDHLGIETAVFFGYSMGARVSAFAALAAPNRISRLVLGGLGSGLVEGVGEWDPIADALLAASLEDVTHSRGRMFRAFADRTRSDRLALAACIRTSRSELTPDEVSRIRQPTLIGVGTKDDIAGSAEDLARMMPSAEAFAIEGRDHMLAVGDRSFKARVLAFLGDEDVVR